MKTALYIDNGRAQLALTAENDFERKALSTFYEATKNGLTSHKGGFYACQGGWTRHASSSEDSVILVADKPE